MAGRNIRYTGILLAVFILTLLCACQSNTAQNIKDSKKPVLVVTYSILGSVVKDLVGESATVTVLIPDGADPHEWEPSAKDIATLDDASVIICNGLGLEGGLEKTLNEAKNRGSKLFVASDHITVRHVGAGEGIPSGDPDQMVGAEDPHLWTDPLAMKSVVAALADELNKDTGLGLQSRSADLQNRLDNLNVELTQLVSTLPVENRKLVTGHESLGYFAQRYGFKLIGAIIPSITTQAEVSAADLANLKDLIQRNKVKTIFTELGTSPAVARAIGDETGVKVIPLATHNLGAGGSYFTFERGLANTIVDGLK